ncbi:Carbohydrate binding domain-containing protein [Filimonas lacunae]|uniref:non-reducing end alpha-L-arabinofuranosidase n=1 Tax=Filimonas lacunae TaxID=477680 RepID=A0A173MCP7_9BACT|nr:alpha-L-arabinofuranosidase C-terminal domain-containing protein [Filimonas lacunae]BAV05290.1 alpha-N-acetylglucosaminidase [Filimonas lacunae]SIT22174.1 Carbohydrate binding domain-containing protein [Filimonas lacunae]
MKKIPLFLLGLFLVKAGQAAPKKNEPDSVYLFSYATAKNNNHNGLHFAWSRDNVHWLAIGNEFGYVQSDYGRWGSEKRMITPYLLQGPDGTWQCVWSLNDKEPRFAGVSTKDLVYWGRQSYPEVSKGNTVLKPVIAYDAQQATYVITYTSGGKYYQVTSKNLATYSAAKEVSAAAYADKSVSLALPAGNVTGQVHRVAWPVVEKLIQNYQLKEYQRLQNAETTLQDSVRFAGLKPVDAGIQVHAELAKPISNTLLGVFFEDINYAADGGLYAELVQNRDFEYAPGDKQGRDSTWNSTHSWKVKGNGVQFAIDTVRPIHPNNPHYAVVTGGSNGGGVVNAGFDGMAVTQGAQYHVSFFARQEAGKSAKVLVQLIDGDKVIAQAVAEVRSGAWKQVSATLTASGSAANAQLYIQPMVNSIHLDMVSLFPARTFKGRKNGLRADLAQAVADIHPRFVRFPGGCVAHGDGIDNIYRWKNSIGPLEARKPQRNLWNYHQSMGLGYFEYFRFCEDMGAEPVPVLAAGVPCQNSGSSAHGGGQQEGIPLNEMDAYIQDVIDLIEYANGAPTTFWGKKRAEAGHPEPFHLKYIGIGNEDLISDVFEERFTLIYKAVRAKHPEITVIGTVGPFFEGTDYKEGWDIASKLRVPMVDEHYYQTPGWFINNQNFYDAYDRNKSKVYLGEYAAHLPGRPNNLETALAEAIYLTAVERNGDVVSMASYAPLLAKEGHTQWSPDLIYFNNTTVKTTVGYEVQKLYGINSGTSYLPAEVAVNNGQDNVKKRVAISVVKDAASGDVIVKMVNLLPVTVNAATNLKGVSIANTQAVKTVLTGKPADKVCKPVESTCTVGEQFVTSLPAYSFTVIRIKTK